MPKDNDLNADLYDLTMSTEAEPLLAAVKQHIHQNVEPIKIGRASCRERV